MKKATVAFHTLGCKLNQAESELLAGQLSRAGYEVVSGNRADICILNTCTVTHVADRKARRWLRLMRRQNPQALIIAAGCYAERAPQEIEQLGVVDLTVGNRDKERLLALVESTKIVGSAPTRGESLQSSRVRAMVKVQDGCHDFCAYCIVPIVRSCEYSLSLTEVVREVKDKVGAGYREIVLTGTKVGCYQFDGFGLKELIEAILKETSVERLRLSSLQPNEISPELLSLWEDARLCRHFHLALQSGSDSILERMSRRYSVSSYRRVVALIREMVPDAAISTDVMVGFPGESEEDFSRTYRLCEEMGFARIHVFLYSPRPGTSAAELSQPVKEMVKRERCEKMLELAQQTAHRFREQFLGRDSEVLWEQEVEVGSGIYSGLTGNYLRVFTRSEEVLTNRLLPAKLVGLYREGVWGEIT